MNAIIIHSNIILRLMQLQNPEAPYLQNWFFSQQYEFNVPNYYITDISLACDNTFVLLARSMGRIQGQHNYIMQFSSQSVLLHQFRVGPNESQFKMLKDDQVIIVNTEELSIDIYSLRNYQKKSIRYQLVIPFQLIEDLWTMLFVFPESNVICLIQRAFYESKQIDESVVPIGVNYYRYRGFHENNQLLYENSQEYYKQNVSFSIQQVDNFSKIVWCVWLNEGQVCYQFRSLNKNMEPVASSIRIRQSYLCNLLVNWMPLWELSDGKFFATADFTNEGFGYFSGDFGVISLRQNETLQIEHLIIDLPEPRKMEFNFTTGPSNQMWLHCQMKSNDFDYTGENVVLLIDSQTGDIIKSEANNHRNFFYYRSIGWKSFLTIQYTKQIRGHCSREEHQISTLKVRLMHTLMESSIEPRDFFMFFLLHINEDFDDDLLMDAINLLQKEEDEMMIQQ